MLDENKADAEQIQAGPHGAHDEVVEGGHIGAALAVGDQRVTGQRGDLHEDVEVEDVAGDRDTEQACDQQREECVKIPLPAGEFGIH